MAAKGSIAKTEIMARILEQYPNSFTPDNKEIRIDMEENGNPVQIKITLTAVKSPISNNPENEVINEEQFSITDTEKANLEEILEGMGVEF